MGAAGTVTKLVSYRNPVTGLYSNHGYTIMIVPLRNRV